MAEEVKAPDVEPIAEPEVEGVEASKTDSFETIVKRLVKDPNCTKFVNLTIKNVNVVEEDNYFRINISLNAKIPGFVPVTVDGISTGEFKKGLTNVIYNSHYALAGTLKNNPNVAFLANGIIKSPNVVPPLLIGSKIEVISQFVPANTDYVNPFTTRENPEPTQFDHDTIINHIVDLELGSTGKLMTNMVLAKYVDAMTI